MPLFCCLCKEGVGGGFAGGAAETRRSYIISESFITHATRTQSRKNPDTPLRYGARTKIHGYGYTPHRHPPMKLKRNDPCHCKSGLKYKKCHLPKEQEADREACAYWKAKIRRVVMDRLADAQMAEMPAPTESIPSPLP